jgi:hypothetical protein
MPYISPSSLSGVALPAETPSNTIRAMTSKDTGNAESMLSHDTMSKLFYDDITLDATTIRGHDYSFLPNVQIQKDYTERREPRSDMSFVLHNSIPRDQVFSVHPAARHSRIIHLESIPEQVDSIEDNQSSKSTSRVHEMEFEAFKSVVSADIFDGLALMRLKMPQLLGAAVLTGSIIIPSFAHEKRLPIRYTFNHWKTTTEISGVREGASRRLSDPESMDKFHFTIDLPIEENLSHTTLLLCARYQFGGREFWEGKSNLNSRHKFSTISVSVIETNSSHDGVAVESFSRTKSDVVEDRVDPEIEETSKMDKSTNTPDDESSIKFLFPEHSCCTHEVWEGSNVPEKPKDISKNLASNSLPILSFEYRVCGDSHRTEVRSAEYQDLLNEFCYHNSYGNLEFAM